MSGTNLKFKKNLKNSKKKSKLWKRGTNISAIIVTTEYVTALQRDLERHNNSVHLRSCGEVISETYLSFVLDEPIGQ